VSQTLQLERTTHRHDVPKLLVEWTSRWDEFFTSIRPAFGPSGERLAGEAPFGIFPYRGFLAAWLLEAFLLFVVIVLPKQIQRLLPYAPPKVKPYEVIYYSGDELPRTEDLGGAESGAAGRAGGREAHHRTQTIRVARGNSLAQKVVDAPNLKLPASMDAVANLLAIKPVPGPPPAEGLHASLTLPNLPASVVAPAPTNVARDRSRGGMTLDSVVPPAPNLSRDKPLTAPPLNSTVVPPAPNVSREHARAAPVMNSNVIAPAPADVTRSKARSAPALNGSVIPPAPGAANPEIMRSPVQMNNVAVVPPPASAPEREATRNPKLTLPAPSVIAPPPSTDASRDLRRLASGSVAGQSSTVVPPPPTPSGSGSMVSNLLGKLFGTQDVVPPPPSSPSESASGNGRSPGGSGSAMATNVIPPPPSAGGSGSAGGSSSGTNRGGSLNTNVIPPPPSATGSGPGRGAGGAAGNAAGAGGGTRLASNVVPPPPGLGSGSGPGGSGSGRQGTGFGGVGDVGSVLAPPSGGGGSGGGSGIVVSNEPGAKVGLPGGAKGSLAMSPAGGDKPGLGGTGGGAGIGHGDGPGSGMTGEGPGAGKSGVGRGSDPNARGGISPTAGPGGAGNASSGTPAVPGVSISGGSTAVVNLPSFGSGGSSNDPNLPGRSSVKEQQGPAITIVATSRSGGAFNFYGVLKGDKVYTVYLDTSLGQAVMQFADPASAAHPYGEDLVGPQQMRTDLPSGLMNSHMVIACTLDASGKLKNFKVLEPGPAVFTAKVMAALPSWKFRPAMRGNQPVEVTAILGFGINTDDRN
jgi:Gram-negative bacterial TonB protein C-terminal